MFLGILLLLTILPLVIKLFIDDYSDLYDGLNIFSTIAGFILVISLIILPFMYYSGKAEVQRYYALKETIDQSRQNKVSDIERAALTKEIADYNKDLAEVKYWNDSVFDIYIPDYLANLKPLN
jgi:cell division protein FtsB